MLLRQRKEEGLPGTGGPWNRRTCILRQREPPVELVSIYFRLYTVIDSTNSPGGNPPRPYAFDEIRKMGTTHPTEPIKAAGADRRGGPAIVLMDRTTAQSANRYCGNRRQQIDRLASWQTGWLAGCCYYHVHRSPSSLAVVRTRRTWDGCLTTSCYFVAFHYSGGSTPIHQMLLCQHASRPGSMDRLVRCL